MPATSVNPFVRTSPSSQSSATPPMDPDPILGQHLEAQGARVPAGVPQPTQGPWVGIRDVSEVDAPEVFWMGAHGGAGTTTLRSIGTQRGITGMTTRRWPRFPGGVRPTPVVLVTRTHAVGLWHAHRVVQEWASGLIKFVDLHGLVLLPDAPGAPPKQVHDDITRLAALVPLTWTISWQPSWRTVAPGNPYPLDARTKLVLGRIRRSLHKKQTATTTTQ